MTQTNNPRLMKGKDKPKHNCGCNLCGRGREYYRIIDQLNKEDREFMHNLYEYILNVEEDNAVYEYDIRKAKEAVKPPGEI